MSALSSPASGAGPLASGVAVSRRPRSAHHQDVQAAARLLLDRYTVLAAEEPDLFRVIRMRARELEAWFYERAGWRLVVTSEGAYLPKIPVRGRAWQGFDTNRDKPLASPLDYELLVWVLWYGERKPLGHTFLVGMLANDFQDEVVPLVGPDHLDWNRADHRLSLVRAMNTLEAMGALRKLDGEAEWFARDGLDADLVYEFTPIARYIRAQPSAALLTPDLVPAAVTLPTPLFEHALTPTQRLYRAVLLEPALHQHEDPEAFALLATPAGRLGVAQDLERQLGWSLEVTNAYAALLRPPREEHAQPTFPTGHIRSRIALLLCDHLRRQVERGRLEVGLSDEIVVAPAVFESELGAVKTTYERHWGTAMRARSLQALAGDLEALLRDWGLLSGPDEDGLLTIHATAARYGAVYTTNDSGLSDEGDDE